MNILSGALEPTAGEIRLDGRPVQLRSPQDARACGIGMVYQHFMLVPTLKVWQNAIMGAEPTRRGCTIDKAAALAVRVFDGLRAHPLPPFSVLNLNYPERDEALGLKATSLRTLRYLDDYEPEIGEDGETRYTLVGGLDKSMADGEDDYTWLKRGYATMTVLTYDLTHDAATKALEGRI